MTQNVSSKQQYEESVRRSQSEWLDYGSRQIDIADEAFEAIDRYIGVRKDDVLLCETTCLGYAAHVLEAGVGVKELWLVPPAYTRSGTTEDLFDRLAGALGENCGALLRSLERYGAFKGLTASVPGGPFKLLVTTQFYDLDLSAFEQPKYNPVWVVMLNTEGATGAVLYPSPDSQKGPYPALNMTLSQGLNYPEGFVRSLEIPGGRVLLALGEPTGTFHMEDLSDPDDPWSLDATAITLALSSGCVIPSVVRHGTKVLEERTLGELASRISRGTTLSERDLDVRELDLSKEATPFGIGEIAYLVGMGGGFAPSTPEFYRYPGDLYYIDGACFKNGAIRPKVLNSMPEGQERYIVDERDGEVLLVSRSSKEIAVYEHIKKKTLIGNSVFVVRLGGDVDMDYLACWMRGDYVKAWMRGAGRRLTKASLASLPVPILTVEAMERTVRRERSIDQEIFDLEQRLASLRLSNRFDPLAAANQHGHEGCEDE